MSYSQADIVALKQAIGLGVRKVRYESGGEVRDITYRSLDEMRAALALMEQDTGLRSPARSVLVSHNRDR